ncbi:MAG: GNAT family N-acetyltransferase [Ignavibacteria bacterium]|nr:GNAT family N-acetyltransferase [Ignavibacteria bacterium]
MEISFSEYSDNRKDDLIKILTSSRWPYHSTPNITMEKVIEQLQNGYFTGEGRRTFIIYAEGTATGVIRLFDLGSGPEDDETPLFDIKIIEEKRGRGVGKTSLRLLTDFVFNEYPNKNRFEATTRVDNTAMRKVFEACGFVKEAHYRQAWPDEHGNKYDCTGYSILRGDWQNNTKTEVKWNS